jgi:hypothetical protein
MKKKLSGLAVIGLLLVASCNNSSSEKQGSAAAQDTMKVQQPDSAGQDGGRDSGRVGDSAATDFLPGSFGYDLDFLRRHDSVIVLSSGQGSGQDGAQVIVSPKYQAKVFTSTAAGDKGQSFGWINYKAFTGPADGHMNAYGGENRIWLGPEGGKFSLFFAKGASMVFGNWKTPPPYDTEAWTVTAQNGRSVSLHKDMQLVNYAGTSLELSVGRSITILNRRAIDSLLHLSPDTAVRAVGYRTMNTITNTGPQAWTGVTGMPCLWMLDMFRPAPATVILVPYREDVKDKKSKPATTDYFGEIPSDRIRYEQGVLLFKADGRSRGKLGLPPTRARSVAGSYDAQNKVLTLILFDRDASGKYLNQEWNTIKPSFSGDAVNAYNDGPLADGSQMGPFYELESVSPAAFLAPGSSLSHKHAVFHFTGDEAGLDRISRKVLGISLEEVKKAF